MIRIIAPTLALLALAPALSAPTAILRLDASPDNRCEQANQGGMWVLELPPAPTNSNQVETVTVELQRTEGSLVQPYDVAYTLTSGQRVELGCSQGTPLVAYQIVSQR